MYINGKWYTETEVQAYVDKLNEQISQRDKFISGVRSYYKSTESWDKLFEEEYNNFAEDINVPAKFATDSNVGDKELKGVKI